MFVLKFSAHENVFRETSQISKNRPVPEFLFNEGEGLTQLCS